MSGRLGGNAVVLKHHPEQVHVMRLAGMEEAAARVRQGAEMRRNIQKIPEERALFASLPPVMLSGDQQLDSILAKADQLIEDAILEDPRLAKKPGWVLAEEGIDACAALLAAGEERAYFDRRKVRLTEAATVEPYRIVISTDSKHVTADHAAAFIASAKLAQQFRPVEIWWQGAWLRESHQSRAGNGWVFLVPLVQGDMDYRRLQFVLSSNKRDRASYSIMFSYAKPASIGWGGAVGEQSYLENTDDFVRESGIQADATHVARYAARWAGMDPIWSDTISGSEAEQYWQAPTPATPYKPYKASAEDKRRWSEDEKRREQEAKEKARLRLEQF